MKTCLQIEGDAERRQLQANLLIKNPDHPWKLRYGGKPATWHLHPLWHYVLLLLHATQSDRWMDEWMDRYDCMETERVRSRGELWMTDRVLIRILQGEQLIQSCFFLIKVEYRAGTWSKWIFVCLDIYFLINSSDSFLVFCKPSELKLVTKV